LGFALSFTVRLAHCGPLIRDEVYRIGHDALSNAFRHAHASEIEVELEYAASHLRVLIRDNGDGIDTQVLRSGREKHWGLSGMKERTERIGGKLRVLSGAVAGTEVGARPNRFQVPVFGAPVGMAPQAASSKGARRGSED
jgi:signal transduction histidine kinase